MENWQTQTIAQTKSGVATKVGIGVMVLLFGLAGSAFSFIRYSRTPEARILESMQRLESAKSAQYDGTIDLSGELKKTIESEMSTFQLLSPEANQPTKFEVHASHKGKFQMQSETNEDFSNSLSIKAKTDIKEYPVFLFDHQSVSGVSYVRFPSLPALLGMNLEFLNSQWISFDFSEVASKYKALRAEAEAKPEAIAQKKENEKILETLTQIIALSPPVQVTKTFRAEKVNGVITTPYSFVINQKNVLSILGKLSQNEKQTGVSKDDVVRYTETMLSVEKFQGKIWIGKKDILPYKIELSFRYNDTKTFDPIDVKIQYILKEYNKPMNIVAPLESMSFEKALQFALEKFKEQQNILNPPTAFPVDQNILEQNDVKNNSQEKIITTFPQTDTDGDGLLDQDEVYYKTDVNNRDTDSDRLTDGKEIHEYHTNPLKKDTDGDGYEDAMEVKSGHDPLTKAK